MIHSFIFAASTVVLTAFASSANAQSAFSGCDSATGLGSSGQPCAELIPLDPNRIAGGPIDAEGGDRFRRLDTSTLGETFECREAIAQGRGAGRGALLIEDCGAPLTLGELGQLEPFFGTTGPTSAPIPATATTAVPTPVAAAPVAPVVSGSALPPIGQIAGTTLAGGQTGFIPLLAVAAPFIAGAAGVAGIAAAAAAGGGSSTPSTQ